MYNLCDVERAFPILAQIAAIEGLFLIMILQMLPLVLFILLTEVSVGSVSVLVFLDWRNEVKRGFLISYTFIYFVLIGLAYLFQQNFATPGLLNSFQMLDHAWTGYQGLPLLLFFLLMIPYGLFLLLDRAAGVDGREKMQKEQAEKQAMPRMSALRILRLLSGIVMVIAGLATLFVMGMIFRPLGGSVFGGAFLVLSFFAAAFALGGVLTAMWLGHWYLVTPALSEKPLLFSTSVVLIAIVIQVALSILAGPSSASALQASKHYSTPNPVTVTALTPASNASNVKPANAPVITPLSTGAIGWLRIVISFVLPLILGGLAWKLVRDRSFQSATGMLYLVVVLTLAGEAMARGLFLVGLS